MARCAIVILSLESVRGTSGVTLVLVHDEMVLAARAVIGPVLATGTVSLAVTAGVVLRICETKITLLMEFHENPRISLIDRSEMDFLVCNVLS